MWSSILASILEIFKSILGYFKTKEEIKKEEFKVKNTEEQVRRAEIVLDVKEKDEAESLVKEVVNPKDNESKQKALEAIRRRIAD
jgi:hypothetical protein